MKVLMVCPAHVVTGGTESIHQFANELNTFKDMDVKIWYWGADLSNPRPVEYEKYNVDYIVRFPDDYKDVIIFPEIWANNVTNVKYKDCIKCIHWLGVNGYYWHTPIEVQGLYLKQTDVIHLSQSEYATNHLLEHGVDKKKILHISDVPNSLFFEDYEEQPRNNVVLFNPAKMTDFQRVLMSRAREEGLVFKPLENLTRDGVAQTMRRAKLYIEFGIWPGRERVPREAALSGCCVIASKLGCAKYYADVSLDEKWKFDIDASNIPSIIKTMKYILNNYDICKGEFDSYKQSVIQDRNNLHTDCEIISKALINARRCAS